jgi:hypothetical protein
MAPVLRFSCGEDAAKKAMIQDHAERGNYESIKRRIREKQSSEET